MKINLQQLKDWWRDRQIQAALLGVFATIMIAWGPSVWAWMFPKSSSTLSVERQIVYARIQRFVDREQGGEPFGKRFVGMPDHSSGTTVDLFDEATYIFAYYLAPHHVEKMEFDVRSSGMCSATPISPTRAALHDYEYQQSGWQRLTGEVLLKDESSGEFATYVLLSQHYYNGYQYNRTAKRYESDGGFRINYPVKELRLIFDFSGMDFLAGIAGTPTVSLMRKSELSDAEPVSATYVNGILSTEILRDLPIGSIVQCKWEWKGESEVLEAMADAGSTSSE